MTAALLGAATVAVVVMAGLGTKWGWWPYTVGLGLLVLGGGGGAVATLVAAWRAVRGRASWGDAGTLAAVVGAVAAAGVLAMLASWAVKGATVPRLYDVSTDVDDPPPFVAVLARRPPSSNSAEWGGPRAAARQRRGYPDVVPLTLPDPPEVALARAVEAARASGWEIVEIDRAAGQFEATDRTKWFGFSDDIVVRVRPAEGGTRVDVRSASRVGRSDVGTNAQRIRAYLARVQAGEVVR